MTEYRDVTALRAELDEMREDGMDLPSIRKALDSAQGTRGGALQIVEVGPGRGCPRVEGRCPACGTRSLFLAVGAHVTCASLTCPAPCEVSDYLDKAPAAVSSAVPGEPTDA